MRRFKYHHVTTFRITFCVRNSFFFVLMISVFDQIAIIMHCDRTFINDNIIKLKNIEYLIKKKNPFIFFVFLDIDLSWTSRFVTFFRRFMQHVNCFYMIYIVSLNHIRRVFDYAVQLSMFFYSLNNYVNKYVFITRNICSWVDVDLYLLRRFASIHKNRFLFKDVFFNFEFKISFMFFSTNAWWNELMITWKSIRNRNDDEIDWDRRNWSRKILDIYILSIMINILLKIHIYVMI